MGQMITRGLEAVRIERQTLRVLCAQVRQSLAQIEPARGQRVVGAGGQRRARRQSGDDLGFDARFEEEALLARAALSLGGGQHLALDDAGLDDPHGYRQFRLVEIAHVLHCGGGAFDVRSEGRLPRIGGRVGDQSRAESYEGGDDGGHGQEDGHSAAAALRARLMVADYDLRDDNALDLGR